MFAPVETARCEKTRKGNENGEGKQKKEGSGKERESGGCGGKNRN